MSNYIFGTTLSYRDYLQTKSFEDDIRSDISKQTRSIIASNEELQREHIKVLEESAEAISSGFEQLSYEVSALSGEISQLRAAFQWGFTQLLMDTARLNDTLDELLRIAKTPAQTWAYEQFEIARDAFGRGLYDDALDYVTRAINGHASNSGYKLEGRFHYLLGTIRLGNFKNNSPHIIDLERAEQAFLDAAKYVTPESDRTKDLRIDPGSYGFLKFRGQACLSYLAAGWAAYCQGKIEDAERHTQLALKCDIPEAHFQVAKIRMHKGNVEPALQALEKAIQRDRGYSLKAAADPDFRSHRAQLDALLCDIRDQARKKAEALFAQSTEKVSRHHNLEIEGVRITANESVKHAITALDAASEAMRHQTYYGYLNAISYCETADVEMRKGISNFRSNSKSRIHHADGELDKRINESRKRSMPCGWVSLMLAGILATFIMACTQCSQAVETRDRQDPRRAAFQQWQKDIRSAGYNPNSFTYEDYRRLGYRFEDLPQQYAGYNGPDPTSTWFSYFFWCLLFSIAIPSVSWQLQKGRQIRALEEERARLKAVDSQLEAFLRASA
jgi:tetratricopeptide (TPR) repeat protein